MCILHNIMLPLNFYAVRMTEQIFYSHASLTTILIIKLQEFIQSCLSRYILYSHVSTTPFSYPDFYSLILAIFNVTVHYCLVSSSHQYILIHNVSDDNLHNPDSEHSSSAVISTISLQSYFILLCYNTTTIVNEPALMHLYILYLST